MLKDLQKGRMGEQLVGNLFTQMGYHVTYCKTKDYDIECRLAANDILVFTTEVKYDIMSAKTGNIAIEYFNSKQNKESGLSSTKANFWVYILPNENENRIYITKTSTLREFIKNNKPLKMIERGGDKNASLLIYKIDDILPIFKRIDDRLARELEVIINEL